MHKHQEAREAYFMLSLLTIRQRFLKQSEIVVDQDDLDLVYTYYEEATQARGLDFHEWPAWLEAQLEKVIDDQIQEITKQSF